MVNAPQQDSETKARRRGNQPTVAAPPAGWAGIDSTIGQHVLQATRQSLASYEVNPLLVSEQANIERAIAEGGYGHRQLFEMVQNSADALLKFTAGKIHVILTADALYCANEGDPITTNGVDAILHSHLSVKRGNEIGRFGLGFKSVLAVTDRPAVYSRTGSFGFDAANAMQQIKTVLPKAERYPVLRTAFPLDAYESARGDSVLAELMHWATTIVKLPLEVTRTEWLSEDFADFPAGFLLFSPHVGSLTLEDRIASKRRSIRIRGISDHVVLEEDGTSSEWQIFADQFVPTAKARADAGELTYREKLPIMWAVPLQGKAASMRGRFWAFFPTEYYTTLSGYLNAPWKMNEDRQNLLRGEFNYELINAAAKLVAGALTKIERAGDPARFLDLMPARGREAPQWADELLTEKVYKHSAKEAIVPDQFEERQCPMDLHLHPSGLPDVALDIWTAYPGRPADWCHPKVDSGPRRSRIERLMDLVGRKPAEPEDWLDALVADRTPEASIAALRAAAVIYMAEASTGTLKAAVRNARIVLTQDGEWVRPQPGTVFIATRATARRSGILFVHAQVASSNAGQTALFDLGIGIVEPASELEAMVRPEEIAKLDEAGWNRFWEIAGRAPLERAIEILKKYTTQRDGSAPIRVRTMAGRFRPIAETLLPGEVVPSDGSRDAAVAIDTGFHISALPILGELGATTFPKPAGAHASEAWYPTYRDWAISKYVGRLPKGTPEPAEHRLRFNKTTSTGPLSMLDELSDEGRVRFTERLLLAAKQEDQWTLSHDTQNNRYPPGKVDPPSVWMAKREGRLQTSLGIRKVQAAVAPELLTWERFFPVAQCGSDISNLLGLADQLDDLTVDHWQAALEVAQALYDGAAMLGNFYGTAAKHITAPQRMRCRKQSDFRLCPTEQVAVAHEADTIAALEQTGAPYIAVASAEECKALIENWKLQPATIVVTVTVSYAASGPETPLLDLFPGLETFLLDEQNELQLVPCTWVRKDTVTAEGTTGEERPVLRDGGTIYYADRLSKAEILDQIILLLTISVPSEQRKLILEQEELNKQRQHKSRIRGLKTPAQKLLEAVGAETIRRRLPKGLIAAAEQEHKKVTDVRAAELALAVYGVETLREFRDELDGAGLGIPKQWSGGHEARKFVSDIGFPAEYAGFPHVNRERMLEVDGPPQLPKLHEFQGIVVECILKLLEGRKEGRRGLLSLPTGAGKTRVAVEALVKAIKLDQLRGPILWITQSDELCEQAVQTWSDVWRGLGPQKRLQINRLWAANEAEPADEVMQVVVATIDKLHSRCVKSINYVWLSKATCVIIDEAHGSITTQYTQVLTWLGLGRGADRCPLIGLTATPFRGGEDETADLVARYQSNRLDAGALGEDQYAELQAMKVLARVEHRILKGTRITLNPFELADLQKYKRAPASVESRIGSDANRNRALLDHIRSQPDDWPILVFAASVDHARTMAALLSTSGITAAAVSGDTEPGARRNYIERFRKGAIRVLTNYAVLTAGFDAPSVRALYVARPVFSPVLYQQMIGRGLRGPLNGGKDKCLIVNVEDNFQQFGEELAFRKFEHLWNPKKADRSS